MRKQLIITILSIIGLLFYFSCTDEEEQTNKITGTIINLGGNPVQGATVTLRVKNVSTTTGASGSFEISTSAMLSGNDDKAYRADLIDTLVISHNNYLGKRKFIYSNSDVISAIIWDTKFRLTNEVSGWVDQPEFFVTFDTTQLYDLIDGGAPEYINEGLVDGIVQSLKKGTDTLCDVSVYNFSTSQNAVAMFTVQTENISDARKLLIAGYDESIAVGERNPLDSGTALIFAHFGQFELEMNFMDHTGVEPIRADAALFLQVYESIIGINSK